MNSLGNTSNGLAMGHVMAQFKEQLEQQLRQWEEKLSPAIYELQIGESSNKPQPPVGLGELLSGSAREIKGISHILAHGQLPWWLADGERISFFSKWTSKDEIQALLNKASFRQLMKDLADHPRQLDRFIKQFSHEQIAILFLEMDQDLKELTNSKTIKTWVKNLPNAELKYPFWSLCWKLFSKRSFEKDFIHACQELWKKTVGASPSHYKESVQLIQELYTTASTIHNYKSWRFNNEYQHFIDHIKHFNKEIEQSIHSDPIKLTKHQQDRIKEMWKRYDAHQSQLEGNENAMQLPAWEAMQLAEGIQLGQAGLVLLHSFIKPLFQSVNLLDKNNQLKDKATAVHLLHYLATKSEQAFEQEMIFEKYCCNMPMDTALDREVVLPQAMKAEAEKLLVEILGHWTAMKNTGADTLRSEFLSRKGKLISNGNHHKLMLEKKTQDILLDRLPWSISLVKWPWRKELLFVEWG